jgi:hypothetical protein
MLAPHWLDAVIDQAMQDGADEYAIAEAIAKNERIVQAIRNGLANQPQSGTYGASGAQVIRREVVNAVSAAN